MAEENSKSSKELVAWVLMGLSVLYDISPVDIIPDIPVIGWVDDFFITAAATMNLIQKTCTDSMLWLGQIAKVLKWITIFIGVIAIALVLLVGTLIVHWIAG